MKQVWTDEDLAQEWHLCGAEMALINNRQGATRLGFAIVLKSFQIDGQFPTSSMCIPLAAIQYVAHQVDIHPDAWAAYPWDGRSVDYHRAEIRAFCGFAEITTAEELRLKRWLIADAIPHEHRVDHLLDALYQRCKGNRLEPPTPGQSTRIIRSAIAEHDRRFCRGQFLKIPATTRSAMDALLVPIPSATDTTEWTLWQQIKAEPGTAGLETLLEAAKRLSLVRVVQLPLTAFYHVPTKLLVRFAKQAAIEAPSELRRHTPALRCTLQASYLRRRTEDLTDHVVDVMIAIIHKMTKKAQGFVVDSIGSALNKAPHKMHTFYHRACPKTPQSRPSSRRDMVPRLIFYTGFRRFSYGKHL